MKKEIIQRILTILLMIAVLVYSFFNYRSGKIDTVYFAVVAVILGYLLVSHIIRVFTDLRNS